MQPPQLDEEEDDLYQILNVARDASEEDIRSAYRRMCVLYHPDKHQTEDLKKVARDMFPKIQKAYAVLSDPQKRGIYDVYGAKAVAAGLELAPYYNTMAELKAEFEMKQRREQEERLINMANAHVKMVVELDATDVFDYDSDDGLLQLLVGGVFVSHLSVAQSIETQITDANSLVISGALTSKDGSGSGQASLTWEHKYSDSCQIHTSMGGGSGRFTSVSVNKTFSNGAGLLLEGVVREIGLQPGTIAIAPNIAATIYRSLGSSAHGALKWSSGIERFMSTRLVYATQHMNILSKLQLGRSDSFLSVSVRRVVTDEVELRGTAMIGLDGPEMSVGIGREFGERSKVAVSLGLSGAHGVTVRLKLTRLNQEYLLPIILSDQVRVDTVACGLLLPLAVFAVIKRFVIDPMTRREEERQLHEKRRKNAAWIAERRKEALAAVKLMQQTVERKVASEQRVNGLVVESAVYGQLLVAPGTAVPSEAPLIDVTVPLQCLVKDSKLRLQPSSKASLVGFYDPCPDEPKQLRVRYRFQNKLHEVTIDDRDELKIPLRKHAVQ
eukprot:m.95146 g.95146  ORF g.95146 m.95146 type:complete len:554 (-) comp18413_c0_seq1:1708-3369(-)